MIPAPILGFLAAIMLAVAAISACRLVAPLASAPLASARLASARLASARPASGADVDITVAHVAMGIAMAGMLATGLRTLPDDAWLAVFALLTAWFGWRVAAETRGLRIGAKITSYHAPHLIHSAAMVYMRAAARTPPGAGGGHGVGQASSAMAGGMGALSAPTVGLAFVLMMTACVVWDVDHLTGMHGHDAGCQAPMVIPARLSQRVALAAVGAMPSSADRIGPDNGVVVAPAVTRNAAGLSGVAGAKGALLDPRAVTVSQVAIGVTMALTLVIML